MTALESQKRNTTPSFLSDVIPLLEVEGLSQTAINALQSVGIEENELESRNVPLKPINDIICKELSCTRHLRWASVDHLAERCLQGLVLSKHDLDPDASGCLDQMTRYMPHGRSILLQTGLGQGKVAAIRGLIHTAQQILSLSVNLFIAIALSYRLYELTQKGTFDYSDFKAVFQANSQRGISSFVRFLAKVDKIWLQLLLASPVLIGAVKGLWDSCQKHPLTEEEMLQLQSAVERHTRPLKGLKESVSAYAWHDNLRQFIPIPCYASVTACVEKTEGYIRDDGRLSLKERSELFTTIECLALQGRGKSRLNAMQSLARIVHSLSIRDFAMMKRAGHSQEVLLQILQVKGQALQTLQRLAAKDPTIKLKSSSVSTLCASYLLWWLGMGNLKSELVCWIFKMVKTGVQVLFRKEIFEIVLEAIRCPDKPGFRMFYGDFEVWANELTTDCFQEVVRQFRLISKQEPLGPFLEQLSNFHLEGVDSLTLVSKALTSNETQAILQVLSQKMVIKYLNLGSNLIGDDAGEIVFPSSLLSLDLRANRIGNGAKGLKLPPSLQKLDLSFNEIGPEGAKGLQLPPSLQSLDLYDNQIGPEGAKGLQLPSSLQDLYLHGNQIGPDGAKGLQLPPSLQSLSLDSNQIGDEGAKGLQLPPSLKLLHLRFNQIGPDGAKGLRLPLSLQDLDLYNNIIGPDGAKGLQLPPSLQKLGLYRNQIGPEGVKGLRFPPSLQWLDLGNNQIGPDGAKELQLPQSLQLLGLYSNQIGPEGAKGLQLPPLLQSLSLNGNGIGPEGAKGLRLPPLLQTLSLSGNGIGPDGAKGLQLPSSLQTLSLSGNGIGSDGAKGLQLPSSLRDLNLYNNGIDSEGAKGLRLPSSLLRLVLWNNQIGPDGAKGLELPSSLQELNLDDNQIGTDGAKGLQLPPSLQELSLNNNQIGPDGAKGLRLPLFLRWLYLNQNEIGSDGAKGLELPSSLQRLTLDNNQLGDEGVEGLQPPSSLLLLYLNNNQIGDAGVKALFKKIPQTNLTYISLSGNEYNTSALNEGRVLQQATLLRRCQDKLCHANTPLQENNLLQNDLLEDEPQTSGATRAVPFFSWLNKPAKFLASRISACATSITKRVDACFTATLDKVGSHLRDALSDSPAYFPNIKSPVIHDHIPSAQLEYSSLTDATLGVSVMPALILPQMYHHAGYLRG